MRLTKSIRDTIVNEVMKTTPALLEKEKNQNETEHGLAVECYNSLFDKQTRKKLSELDAKWFRVDNCLRFNVNGMNIRLFLNCEHNEGLRVPYATSCTYLGVIEGELADRVYAFMEQKKSNSEDRDKIQRNIRALIYSCSSFKALEETWPEGAQFYQKFEEKVSYKTGLPAVLISDINKSLELSEAA